MLLKSQIFDFLPNHLRDIKCAENGLINKSKI